MNLIIGGAYQGKATWASQAYQAKTFGDFPAEGVACQCHLEAFSRACTAKNADPVEEMKRLKPLWQDCVIVSREVGCGVVPMDKEERAWREDHGRLLRYLVGEAESVTRIICGLPEVLK